MPNPTVSIIVPVYNTKKEYLDKCIESLVSQTLKDIELIFVDDGSTDDTLEYLRTKEKLYPQMRVIAQGENKRQGGARNTGIRAARGEYIAFCDSDDYWLPEKINTQIQYFKDHPECEIVFTKYENIFENDELKKNKRAIRSN